MVGVDEVAANIYLIDDQLYSIPQLGGVYLLDEEKKAIIDSGPVSSADVVLDGIRQIGVRPENIDYIILTHIHLDHAGGAGVLLKNMPQAQVIVHHKGARHLVNPASLVKSAIEVLGEEALAREGEVIPIKREQVRPAYDGDVIRLSEKQILSFIDAPGHAPHVLCIHESRNNGLFVGDVVGIRIAGDSEVLLVATPPPSFDADDWINTLKRLTKLNASIIYFSHFGTSNNAQDYLRLAINKLEAWYDMVVEAVQESGLDRLLEKMIAQARAELEPIRKMEAHYKHLTEDVLPVIVAGYIEYYRRKHEVKPGKRRKSESN